MYKCACVCVCLCVHMHVCGVCSYACVPVHVYRHEDEIDKIVRCALKELELENEFRAIEEHWNEQVNSPHARIVYDS